MRIKKLTPEQEQQLPEFREYWRAIGLSTDALDDDEARAAVAGLYEAAGLQPPAIMLLSSPAMCLLARGALMGAFSLRGQLGGQLGDQLWGQLWGQLGDQLGDQLWGQLGGQLWGSPWTIGGQDAFWLSFYDFGKQIGATYTNDAHFEAYKRYAKSCGWMFAYEQIAFVSRRPVEIHFDDEGRLHNENGMSIKFSDGWGVYSWRGTAVPGEWIEDKDSITPKTALTHENIEQRRCAAEIVGWHNVLAQLNPKTIDRDPDPQIGELIEVDLPDVGREKFLRVECGTGREFAIPMPPEMQTALQANAWSYGLNPEDYKPEVRT